MSIFISSSLSFLRKIEYPERIKSKGDAKSNDKEYRIEIKGFFQLAGLQGISFLQEYSYRKKLGQ
jgi:hypothetical protein